MLKLKFTLLTLSVLAIQTIASAQLPYTQAAYSYDSLMNVVYGTAIDYAGHTDTLEMDIYKPLGDNNCARPVMVIAHGGAWVGGSKEDINTVLISRYLAKRGWVVANINWRLGTHKTSSYNMYALCNTTISAPCGYISDSAEVFRANFRGMQDMKGAIRFMKNRFLIDSTDINNVFVSGESAGGFVALATAFTDQASEKHPACFAIADAPTPSSNLNTYGCIPSPNDLSRPDLGSIDGDLNLGIHDASVKGVGNFYGALFDLTSLNQVADTPSVYLFHQGADIVVNYNFGRVLGRTSWECFQQSNICQPYYFYPFAYGSKSIATYYTSLGAAAPTFQADIIENYSYLNNCFSNGHSIDNVYTRAQAMIDLFANDIDASGNDPLTNCTTFSLEEDLSSQIQLYPNPVANELNISGIYATMTFTITDQLGRIVLKGTIDPKTTVIATNSLTSGSYILHFNEYGKALHFIKK